MATPGDDVEIVQHNPQSSIVQSQMTLDRTRDRYGSVGVAVRAVGDWNDPDHRCLGFRLLHNQHDRAGSVLSAFDVPRSASSLETYEYAMIRPTSGCGNSMHNPNEIAPDADSSSMIAALQGPQFYRRWFSRVPLNDALVKDIVKRVCKSQKTCLRDTNPVAFSAAVADSPQESARHFSLRVPCRGVCCEASRRIDKKRR
jgi:hypothetical protein